jgi:hypothetical protein
VVEVGNGPEEEEEESDTYKAFCVVLDELGSILNSKIALSLQNRLVR